jgi:hypothetical protein
MRGLRFALLALGAMTFAVTKVIAADLYFHGMTDDQAQREAAFVNNAPPPAGNLTFSSSGPNPANTTPIQQVMGNPNAEFIPNHLACWWVGNFSGTINGNIEMDWTWQTSNADGVVQGVAVVFKVVADPNFATPGVGTQNVIGAGSATWSFGLVNTPQTFHTVIPVTGTVSSRLLIQVATMFVNTGPGLTALYDSPSAPSKWNPYPDDASPGACCDPTSGTCSVLSSAACAAANGIFKGPSTTCSPNPCSIVTPCVLPGVLTVVDPPGDQDAPPVINPQQDLRSVSIAEPYGDPLGDVFVITMKTASLDPASLPPNTFWRTSFNTPDGGLYWVWMINCAAGGVSYQYGHYTTGSVTDGSADAGAHFADGTIRITVTKSKFTGVAPGGTLTNVNGDVRFVGGDCPPLNAAAYGPIDTSTPSEYLIRGNNYCKPQTVSCPADFTGEPGDYPVSFTVNNPSTMPRRYKASLSDPQSWVVGGPIVDVSLGPVAAGGSASLPVVLRLTGPCDPAVEDQLVWSVTAQDLPTPSNVASCQTTATCFESTVGVGDEGIRSFSFGLLGSNPFRGEGWFRYTLPAPSRVKVEVFGIRGEKLRTLVDREQDAGSYNVSLRLHDRDAGVLGAGVYLVRITAGNEVRNLRVVGLN